MASGKVPKSSLMAGRPFRRTPFLSGTVKTFFSPGRDHDALDPSNYQAPADWRPSGGILTMPQVVWLSCMVPCRMDLTAEWVDDGFGDFSPVETDVGDDPFIPGEVADGETAWLGEWLNDNGTAEPIRWRWTELFLKAGINVVSGFSGTSVGFGTPWNASCTVFQGERRRLASAFRDVKQRIEGARPGRTWVVIEPFHAPGSEGKWNFAGDFYPHLAAPSTTEFVGTDFLHVYVGSVVRDYRYVSTEPGAEGTSDARAFFNYTYSDSTLTAAKARLRAAYPKFQSYATVLYGYDAQFTGTQATQTYPDVLDGSWAMAGGPDTVDFDSADGNAFMQAEAADMRDANFSYGGLSQSLTASSLAQLIADHFGFSL